jgi:hypothetical protein
MEKAQKKKKKKIIDKVGIIFQALKHSRSIEMEASE